ncbi:MAG: hypothetical protein BWY09_00691 [Candidatus Hydrogenedentes bacterium ADurb.Bin179]|nr:MAG: hypothetical protein BWY09_00691 [Candidatus Hydrogenedentes bacterium ADurb.Bin179]
MAHHDKVLVLREGREDHGCRLNFNVVKHRYLAYGDHCSQTGFLGLAEIIGNQRKNIFWIGLGIHGETASAIRVYGKCQA